MCSNNMTIGVAVCSLSFNDATYICSSNTDVGEETKRHDGGHAITHRPPHLQCPHQMRSPQYVLEETMAIPNANTLNPARKSTHSQWD